MVSDYNGLVDLHKRTPIDYTLDTDVRSRKIALSDIQKYKLVIYHADWATNSSNFPTDHDAYALYLNQGGNMIISGGGNLSAAVQAVELASQQTFESYFGITYNLSSTTSASNGYLQKAWFVQGKKQVANFHDFDIAFDLNPTVATSQPFYSNGVLICPDPNESFINVINLRKGLGPLTLFNSYQTDNGTNVTPIFKYGSKPVYVQPSNANPNYYCPQTQADFTSVNDKIIALRKVIPNRSTGYIFGVPLSNLTYASSKQLLNDIMAELGM
jgi:hypothetical protein